MSHRVVQLALVADSEEAYTGYVARSIVEQWKNTTPREVKYITSFDDFLGEDIFGDNHIYVLQVSKKAALAPLVESLENHLQEPDVFTTDGLVITTQLSKVTLKKLMAVVEKLQGRVYVSEKKKVDTSKALISKTSLNYDAKSYALTYVGEDYGSLVPLIEAVSALPPATQKRISVEQIALRMPQPPGSVPVWDLEQPFFNKQPARFIETNRRVPMTSNKPMLASGYLLKQMENIMLFQAVGAEHMSAITGVKGYPLKKIAGYARTLNPEAVREGVKLLAECDTNLKGGSRVNGLTVFETTALQIMDTF